MIDYIHFDLFGKSGINKQLEITHPGGTITNKDLYSEQFSLEESISTAETLKFGACEASALKFRVRNSPAISSLVGQRLSTKLILNHDTENPLDLGRHKGYSDTPTADRKYRDIVAYDAMFDIINADVATWYAAQYFPMTLRAFRQSFAAHFGLEEVNAELVNDDLIVERTIIANEVSGKTILTAICEINGCFGHINRAGKLEYVRLKSRQSAEIRKYKSPLRYENYVVEAITKVQIRQEEGDVGGTFGEGNNCYIVDGNFLAYGKTQDELIGIAENLLGEIGGISYRPCNVSTYGNPCIEVGDGLTIHTSDMDIVAIVTSRAFKGIQAMQDTYTSSGKEKQLQQLNSVRDELRKLRARANVLTRTLEETRSEITRLESYVADNYMTSEAASSLIKQSADGILEQVNSTFTTKGEVEALVEGLQGQIDGNIQTWTGTETPTLDNYPAVAWDDMATRNQHIGDLYYVESQGNDSGFCYRFQQNNGVYEWVLLKDTEITKALKDAADALQGLGEVKVDLDANYSTTVEMTAEIQKSAEQISQNVSSIYATKIESGKVLSDAQKYTDSKNKENITKVSIFYAIGSSPTEAPESGWSTTPPQWTAGMYMWQKTLTEYGDGSSAESQPVNISGAQGKDGENAENLRIDSSGGFTLKEDESVTLTARIFDGTTEIDPDGELSYLWWKSVDGNNYEALAAGKTVTVSESMYESFMDVYFTCEDSAATVAIAGRAIVGISIVG